MRVFDYCAPLGGRWRRIILLVSLREHSGYYVSEMIAEICRCGGATHASHGWPWMATQGLRGAGTAQRNAAAGASLVRQAPRPHPRRRPPPGHIPDSALASALLRQESIPCAARSSPLDRGRSGPLRNNEPEGAKNRIR